MGNLKQREYLAGLSKFLAIVCWTPVGLQLLKWLMYEDCQFGYRIIYSLFFSVLGAFFVSLGYNLLKEDK